MTAHARLFLRVSSRAVCEWKLEGENEASFSPNFKPSVDGNEFCYLKRHWDFDRDASGVNFPKAADGKWPLKITSEISYIHTYL